jgi:hypothetical protein
MDTSNLWQKDKYTSVINELLGWMCNEAQTLPEVRVVVFVIRLSIGFHREATNARLDYKKFSTACGFSISTICRTINKLLKEKRLFRSEPLGDAYYYSVYPPGVGKSFTDAKKHGAHATINGMDAKKHGVDASPSCTHANTFPIQAAPQICSSANKDINKPLRERVKEEPYSLPLYKFILLEEWILLSGKYDSAWLERQLADYPNRLQRGGISFDRLAAMLQVDWGKTKPAKDYRRETAEYDAYWKGVIGEYEEDWGKNGENIPKGGVSDF